MHTRRELSHGEVEGAHRLVCAGNAGLQAAGRLAIDPGHEVALARLGHAIDRGGRQNIAHARVDHGGGRDAHGVEGAHPRDLRADVAVAAVARTVHAQDGARTVGRRDGEDRVLAVLEERDLRRRKGPGGQRTRG